MRAVVQRVSRARVTVAGRPVGEIGRGLLVLLGVAETDAALDAARLAAKIAGLRVFEDAVGKMNLSLGEKGGAVLIISQFTLYGDVRRGKRPSFDRAAPPALARELYEAFCAAVEAEGVRCERGEFGEHMDVELVNDGPVTLVIDTEELDRPRRA
ncbi:MAG: D-tyrosyl-tRNA(Tyr) deacylase [Thermoflexaceae bacterium]|nr:D-tyrosyl-tRNA(Tyr) deacylase [Thermoflexaceae bacterium]